MFELPVLVGLAQLLLVGLALAIVVAAVHTAWSLTHPRRRTYAWAVTQGLAGDPGELEPPRPFEAFSFRGLRHELPAWRVPGDDPNGPVVVMTHGWGSSRIGGLKRLAAVLTHARGAVLWDLPGHGESAGSARMGTDEHRDLLALLDSVGDVPVVLFGWSLGAGVSLRAAAEDSGAHDIRAVVCEAPYIDPVTPARNVMRLRGRPRRVNLPLAMAGLGVRLGVGPGWAGFARDVHAARLGPVPLMVLHGDADAVCPVAHGRAVADAAANGRLAVIPGGGHNNLWTDPAFEPASRRALGDALRAASAAPARTYDRP